MLGKTKVIYGDVTSEELKKIMEDYDFIVDMRSTTAEPLERILAKGKANSKSKKDKVRVKPRTKINMW